MKLANQVCLVVIALVVVCAIQRGCGGPADVVPTELHGYVLGTHDLKKLLPDEQQLIVDGPEIRQWMDEHGLKGHYRFCGPSQKFGPEDAALQKLIDKPRTSPDWFYAGDYSGPMPANVSEAEAIISKHAL